MTMNDFRTDLQFSHSMENAAWWDTVYQKAFGPFMISHHRLTHDGWHQRAGVDRVILCRDSTIYHIDEKVRRQDWPDILLEIDAEWYGDGDTRNKKGWAIKDAKTDFIAYAFVPSQTCYLLPFPMLRLALKNNWLTWDALASNNQHGFRHVQAANKSYVTRSIAVPIATLTEALRDALCISWKDN